MIRFGDSSIKIFSIVALLVCILILLAIFLPGLLTADNARKESSALTALAKIRSAEKAFRNMGANRYGTLKELVEKGVIDSTLEDSVENGYRFTLKLEGAGYEVVATPLKSDCTRCRSFYLDQSENIRGAAKNGADANVTDPVLGT